MNTEEKIKEAINRGFIYDAITGNIYGISGKLITNKTKDGYIRCSIKIDNKFTFIRGHLFAWYYTYNKMPKNQIDHINRIREDNRICNLRDVTNQENAQNRTKYGKSSYDNNCWDTENAKQYRKNYYKKYIRKLA